MYKKISPEEAYELFKNGEWTPLDVRSEEEYNSGHIDGAVNVPLPKLMTIYDIYPDMNENLIVYCHSGARSARAAAFLDEIGYTNILDLGGIIAYQKYLHSREK